MQKHMSNEAYHADTTRISKSGLDNIRRSPAHYWARNLDPNRVKKEPTPAQLLGTAVHHAILEPVEFERRYQVFPDINKRSNAGKEEFAALMEHAKLNNITFLSQADLDLCRFMRDSARRHPAAKLLLENGEAETTIFWTDQETGAPCKARPDFISETGFIADVKTTVDASPTEFGRSSYNYRYPVQSAFYMDGFKEAYEVPAEGFAFIAVEKEPPYAVAVYYMTPDAYRLGLKEYLTDLQTYMKCLATDQWPAYSHDFLPLELPAWATRNL